MRRRALFCSLLALGFVGISDAQADTVLVPDTPGARFAFLLGQQIGQGVADLVRSRQGFRDLAARVQEARRAVDECGSCADAPRLRADLESARHAEESVRELGQSMAADLDRRYQTSMGPLLGMVMGSPSAETQNVARARQLIAAYCYAQEGGTSAPRDWHRVDACKSGIPPPAFAEINNGARASCLQQARASSGFTGDAYPRLNAPAAVRESYFKLQNAQTACDKDIPYDKVTVAIRQGCHLAVNYYLDPKLNDTGFQMECDNGPKPVRPQNPDLASSSVTPLSRESFGYNARVANPAYIEAMAASELPAPALLPIPDSPLRPVTPIERRDFDYSDLEQWMAQADQAIRHTRRVLEQTAHARAPQESPSDSADQSSAVREETEGSRRTMPASSATADRQYRAGDRGARAERLLISCGRCECLNE